MTMGKAEQMYKQAKRHTYLVGDDVVRGDARDGLVCRVVRAKEGKRSLARHDLCWIVVKEQGASGKNSSVEKG
jgi:hypothetical protein